MSAPRLRFPLTPSLFDPPFSLVRLYRHPGGDWEPPPPEFRNLRADPPSGHKEEFAVLYTASTLEAAAVECRVLAVDRDDLWYYSSGRAKQYKIARYTVTKPALFLPIDGTNRAALGLQDLPRSSAQQYEVFQQVALSIYQRYGALLHGLSWASYHRGQLGTVFAIYHRHKATLGLERISRGPGSLTDDPEWKQYLADNTDLQEVA